MGEGAQKAILRSAAKASVVESAAKKEDVRRGEQLYQQTLQQLGREGTYGEPGQRKPSILRRKSQSMFKRLAGAENVTKPYLLNVPEALRRQMGSKQFQIASRLTAESEQLLKREGPLYERMQRSMQAPILQRGAQMTEESLDMLNQQFARGGRARREGLKEALQMQSQMEANEFVGQQMAQANANLDMWARDNARTQLQFNQAWAANQAFVRDTYTQGMGAARSFMVQSGIPAYAQYNTQAEAINQRGKKNWVEIGMGALQTVAGAAMTAFVPGGQAAGVGMMAGGMGRAAGGLGGFGQLGGAATGEGTAAAGAAEMMPAGGGVTIRQ